MVSACLEKIAEQEGRIICGLLGVLPHAQLDMFEATGAEFYWHRSHPDVSVQIDAACGDVPLVKAEHPLIMLPEVNAASVYQGFYRTLIAYSDEWEVEKEFSYLAETGAVYTAGIKDHLLSLETRPDRHKNFLTDCQKLVSLKHQVSSVSEKTLSAVFENMVVSEFGEDLASQFHIQFRLSSAQASLAIAALYLSTLTAADTLKVQARAEIMAKSYALAVQSRESLNSGKLATFDAASGLRLVKPVETSLYQILKSDREHAVESKSKMPAPLIAFGPRRRAVGMTM